MTNLNGLPIPQDVPLPKKELKDASTDELAQAESKTDAANFLARLMGRKEITRSNIVADADTVRVTRLNGRLTFRHLHPQDPPTIMIPDPEARNGYLCPSCGDEVDSSTAMILAQDVKIEESATAYYEAEEKEYQDTPVVEVGGKTTEFSLKLRFMMQTPEAIKLCVGKLAGLGHQIIGYTVAEQTLAALMPGLIVDPNATPTEAKTGVQEVTLCFEDKNAMYRFFQDEKAKKVHKRFYESEDAKKLAKAVEGQE